MENKKDLVNRVLIGIDSGTIVFDGWKFRYNNKNKGIEAYTDSKSIIEIQNICNGINENFEIVAERLIDKINC